jgi:hypothetical protein
MINGWLDFILFHFIILSDTDLVDLRWNLWRLLKKMEVGGTEENLGSD